MDTQATKTQSINLAIDGMSCNHCVMAVTRSLAAVAGARVESVSVGRAKVSAPESLTGEILRAVERAGYTGRVVASPGA